MQIASADIRPDIYNEWAVSLMIADGHLILLRASCGHVWNKHTLSPGSVRNTLNEGLVLLGGGQTGHVDDGGHALILPILLHSLTYAKYDT